MNVYCLTIDGNTEVWGAISMAKAVEMARDDFVLQLMADGGFTTVEQAHYDFNSIMESATHVGELKNWPTQKSRIEIVEAERPE